jgi:hypothetical protein
MLVTCPRAHLIVCGHHGAVEHHQAQHRWRGTTPQPGHTLLRNQTLQQTHRSHFWLLQLYLCNPESTSTLLTPLKKHQQQCELIITHVRNKVLTSSYVATIELLSMTRRSTDGVAPLHSPATPCCAITPFSTAVMERVVALGACLSNNSSSSSSRVSELHAVFAGVFVHCCFWPAA